MTSLTAINNKFNISFGKHPQAYQSLDGVITICSILKSAVASAGQMTPGRVWAKIDLDKVAIRIPDDSYINLCYPTPKTYILSRIWVDNNDRLIFYPETSTTDYVENTWPRKPQGQWEDLCLRLPLEDWQDPAQTPHYSSYYKCFDLRDPQIIPKLGEVIAHIAKTKEKRRKK